MCIRDRNQPNRLETFSFNYEVMYPRYNALRYRPIWRARTSVRSTSPTRPRPYHRPGRYLHRPNRISPSNAASSTPRLSVTNAGAALYSRSYSVASHVPCPCCRPCPCHRAGLCFCSCSCCVGDGVRASGASRTRSPGTSRTGSSFRGVSRSSSVPSRPLVPPLEPFRNHLEQ